MWDFLGILVDAAVDLLTLRWWYGDTNEEHRGCYWTIILFIVLCVVFGVVVWLVMRS